MPSEGLLQDFISNHWWAENEEETIVELVRNEAKEQQFHPEERQKQARMRKGKTPLLHGKLGRPTWQKPNGNTIKGPSPEGDPDCSWACKRRGVRKPLPTHFQVWLLLCSPTSIQVGPLQLCCGQFVWWAAWGSKRRDGIKDWECTSLALEITLLDNSWEARWNVRDQWQQETLASLKIESSGNPGSLLLPWALSPFTLLHWPL